MKFTIPGSKSPKVVDRRDFVAYWSSRYQYRNEALYLRNVGKVLSAARVRKLFVWKNGRPLSVKKRATVEHLRADLLPRRAGVEAVRQYLLRPGGPIWRIFWVHLQRPARFPIFDRHVYAAMAHLTARGPETIPPRPVDKISTYLDRYLAFFAAFRGLNRRLVDRALMMYGKQLQQPGGPESNYAFQRTHSRVTPRAKHGARR